jgi:hypothetical protein
MKNLSRTSLLHVLPAGHRPASKLPLTTPDRAAGGPGETTARSLARRLGLALHDLGLTGVLPLGWIAVDGATIRLGDLDVPTADHLIRHLEDLAAQVADTLDAAARRARTAGPGQTPLFGDTP